MKRWDVWAVVLMVVIVLVTALYVASREPEKEVVFKQLPPLPAAEICDGSTCWDATGAQQKIVLLEVENERLRIDLGHARGRLKRLVCRFNEVAWWDMTGTQRVCVPSPLPFPD